MIPLFIDVTGRRIVIFGGGDVAARKAAYFSGRAAVDVVSRSFMPAFAGLDVNRIKADLGPDSDTTVRTYLDGAFLVIAATSDPGINNDIGRICRQSNVLFNNADGESGDVILPAIAAGKNYTIAVSTSGSSPAVSRYVREKIEEIFPALDDMIALQSRLRDVLKEMEPEQEKRSAILTRVLQDPAVWAAIEAKKPGVWDDILARYVR